MTQVVPYCVRECSIRADFRARQMENRMHHVLDTVDSL
jgi:hypothetical protein